MSNDTKSPCPSAPDPEETIPLVISVAAEHVDTLERWAARSGMSGIELLDSFVTRVFGPLGARIER